MAIIINKKAIEKFLENYNIGRLLSYCRIKKGVVNKVIFCKTTKAKYVLKISIRNNPYKIKYEIELLNFIKNLSTPKPIKAKNDKYLLNFNKTNKAFIYDFLPGCQKKTITPIMLQQVGGFLGELHLQTQHFSSSIKRVKMYDASKKHLRKTINYSKEADRFNKELNYIEDNIFNYQLQKSLPQGAVHIDLKPDNALFVKNKLTGVIDFDNSYNGPLLLDLAKSMMWFCTQNAKFNINKALYIYEAYRQKRKLAKLEKEYLFNALHFAYLSHVLNDIDYNITKNLPLNYVKWVINNLLPAQKNLTIPKQKFKKIFN